MYPKGYWPFNKGLAGRLQRRRVAPVGRFQNGRIPWNVPVPVPVLELSTTPDQDINNAPVVEMNVEQKDIKDEPTITSTSAVHNDGIKTRSQLLVSSYDLKTEEEDWSSLSGMRFVDHEEMMKMLNFVIKAHTKEFKYCKNPEILAHRQVKWGVCWKYTLRCKNCTYMSPVIKLYKKLTPINLVPTLGHPMLQ
ncbi:unnamed protein product [Mytilus coruscus]|uniref:Mutator-like transposase domain-containing protein n=1 Tax=Mytilus coruscus TaxID=42192 RepID=A0A6J8C3G4_MYTCO|nr:unnamed protein product [Mytilus coruscus]